MRYSSERLGVFGRRLPPSPGRQVLHGSFNTAFTFLLALVSFATLVTSPTAEASSEGKGARVTVTPTSGLTTTEGASPTTFTIVLDTEPKADVVIPLSSSDLTEGTVWPASVTFTRDNALTAQTITITGVDDSLVDGTVPYTIVTGTTVSNDKKFDGLEVADVSVAQTDNDEGAFTVAQTGGTAAVSESGSTSTFTVVLGAGPGTSVVISATSDDAGEATVSPPRLIFGPANWTIPQTITVAGVDDVVVDGAQTSHVTLAVIDASSDDAFDALADQTVSVITTDDDSAGFTIAEVGGSTVVSENATTDTFTVALTSQPLGIVVLTVTSSNTTDVTVVTPTLTFSAADWNTPKNVILRGHDDAADDGEGRSTITVAVDAALTGDDYNAVASQTVTATNTDNDEPGNVGFMEQTAAMVVGTTVEHTVGRVAANATGAVLTVVVEPRANSSGAVVFAATMLAARPAGTDNTTAVTPMAQWWEMELTENGTDVPVRNVTVQFYLSDSWLAQCTTAAQAQFGSGGTCGVRLFHWVNGSWEVLVASFVSRTTDDAGSIYSATVTSLSPFGAGAVAVAAAGGSGAGASRGTGVGDIQLAPSVIAPVPPVAAPILDHFEEPGPADDIVQAGPEIVNIPRPDSAPDVGLMLLVGLGAVITIGGGVLAARHDLPQRGLRAGASASRRAATSVRVGLAWTAEKSLVACESLACEARALWIGLRRPGQPRDGVPTLRHLSFQAQQASRVFDDFCRARQSGRPNAAALGKLALSEAQLFNELVFRARRQDQRQAARMLETPILELSVSIDARKTPVGLPPDLDLGNADVPITPAVALAGALKVNGSLARLIDARRHGRNPEPHVRNQALAAVRELIRILTHLQAQRTGQHVGTLEAASPGE